MVEEMRTEAMDLSANACEKHSTNNEVSYIGLCLTLIIVILIKECVIFRNYK